MRNSSKNKNKIETTIKRKNKYKERNDNKHKKKKIKTNTINKTVITHFWNEKMIIKILMRNILRIVTCPKNLPWML